MAASKTGPRAKKIYPSVDIALQAIRRELINNPKQTTRGFWVEGKKFIARKTNVTTGYVNLTLSEG